MIFLQILYSNIQKRPRILATRLLPFYWSLFVKNLLDMLSWTPQSELSRWVKVQFKQLSQPSQDVMSSGHWQSKQMSHCPVPIQTASLINSIYFFYLRTLGWKICTSLSINRTSTTRKRLTQMTAKFEGQWLSKYYLSDSKWALDTLSKSLEKG